MTAVEGEEGRQGTSVFRGRTEPLTYPTRKRDRNLLVNGVSTERLPIRI